MVFLLLTQCGTKIKIRIHCSSCLRSRVLLHENCYLRFQHCERYLGTGNTVAYQERQRDVIRHVLCAAHIT